MKKATLNLKEDITIDNVMGLVSRLREYQENNATTPNEIIHFYESIREQFYFNKKIEKQAGYLLYDFVNSEITLAYYKRLNIKSIDKPVLRVNPLISAEKLSSVLYNSLKREGWIKCDEELFKRLFIVGEKPLYPIPFWGGQAQLTKLLNGLTVEKKIKGKNQRVLIEQGYRKMVTEYFVDKKGNEYNMASLTTSKSKKSDIYKSQIVDIILEEVYKLFCPPLH